MLGLFEYDSLHEFTVHEFPAILFVYCSGWKKFVFVVRRVFLEGVSVSGLAVRRFLLVFVSFN